jgi:hypothetical protein
LSINDVELKRISHAADSRVKEVGQLSADTVKRLHHGSPEAAIRHGGTGEEIAETLGLAVAVNARGALVCSTRVMER